MAARVLAVLAALLVFGGFSGGVEQASDEVTSRRFMDHLMSVNGCGRFAGLMNATADATKIFHYSLLVHGGLVVFCPDDKAVAAFEPSFNELCPDGQLAVLLYHGVARASLKDRRPTKMLVVPTLATDFANGRYRLTIRHRGDAMELLSSATASWSVATVTRTVRHEEDYLVVYLIGAVLLPNELIGCGDGSFDEGPSPEEIQWHIRARVLAAFFIFSAIVLGLLAFMAVLCLIGGVMYYVASVVTARLSPTRVAHCSTDRRCS